MVGEDEVSFISIDGDVWPEKDRKCRAAACGQVQDLELAIKECKQKLVAVQAGGNCGIWPRYLSKHFRVVYTFEPDADNFYCLCRNAPERNIIKMQAALGKSQPPAAMHIDPENIGAHRIEVIPGIVPVITLDDLRLNACDLIQLDIEGYEPWALYGAEKTIKEFHPVVMIEQKGKEQLYGFEPKAAENLLKCWGYKKQTAIGRDLIFVYE